MTEQSKVLITGASGFIGGELAKVAREKNWEVHGIGRRPIELENYHRHDLSQPLNLTLKPDVVVHAAALSSPWGKRSTYFKHNVQATQNVIDYCQDNGKPHLIFISSSSVYYQSSHQLKLTEQTPLPDRHVNHYAETKRLAEARIQTYPGEWTILRPRAVFGPGDTVLFPRIMRAARAGRLPLLVANEPVIGDLIYIENLVDCILTAMSQPSGMGTINLTNNEPIAIVDFLLSVFKHLEVPEPKKRVPVATAMRLAHGLEILHRVLLPWREPPITRFGVHVFAYSKTFDVQKMLRYMGPPRISLEEGAQRFADWVRKEKPY